MEVATEVLTEQFGFSPVQLQFERLRSRKIVVAIVIDGERRELLRKEGFLAIDPEELFSLFHQLRTRPSDGYSTQYMQ